MSELQKRLDRYTNSEYADPLAIGLIMELKAHLRSANKGAEFASLFAYNRWKESFEVEKRVKVLEAAQELGSP